MSRKFRPDQCPKCYWSRYFDKLSIKDGASPYCTYNAYPTDLIGKTSRPCPDFEPKAEGK